ncbi:MAG TPA: glycerophosphodiester phosphodiesterase family protein, partial [Bradyrhizobium sp.]|nr:glycerophosphodiester phosphodiesterase family protein [Bradyrhizobium sp.]
MNTGICPVKADCDRMRSFARNRANTAPASTAEPQAPPRAAAAMRAPVIPSLPRHDIGGVPLVAAENPKAAAAPRYAAASPIYQRRDTGWSGPDYGAPLQAYARPGSRLASRDEAPAAPSLPNRTGLPGGLKAGVEALSGLSMDKVRVHYNSPEPARVDAHAYAQGNDIHLAPGRQTDLAHEAWHVVQQAQGRVTPTMRMAGRAINHDRRLEAEADEMGSKLLSAGPPAREALAPAPGTPPSLDGSPVQRVFRSESDNAEIGPETIVQVLSEQNFQTPGDLPLNKLVKKLAEGPDIIVNPTEPVSVVAAVNARLWGPAGALMTAAKTEGGSAARKINRILGNMQNRLKGLPEGVVRQISAEHVEKISQQMQQAFFNNNEQDRADLVKAFAASSLQYLEVFSKISADPESVRDVWLGFGIVNQLGPLVHSVKELLLKTGDADGAAYLDQVQTKNLEILKQIRLNLAKRETIAVVAHRGTGPTNKNMGGLISQEDDRRKYRLPENSPAAFNFALDTAAASLDKGPPGLDGIECDVYLSSDGVPIVSHERNVKEQLNEARQKSWPHGNSKYVDQLTADQLKSIQRTETAGSNFMTLRELLEITYANVAPGYFFVTGRPFRIEVEMKGTDLKKKKPNPAARMKVAKALTDATAKVISKMVKRYPDVPVEYVLFNSTEGDVRQFAELRQTKTALGGIYAGLGIPPFDEKAADWLQKRAILMGGGLKPDKHLDEVLDELRYGFNVDSQISNSPLQFTLQNLKNYIVTLVFGQEFPPIELVNQMNLKETRITQPSRDLEGTKGTGIVELDKQKRMRNEETSADESR